MNKLIVFFAATVALTAAFGEMDAAKKALFEQRTGGFLIRPNTAKGKLAVINAQTTFPLSVAKAIAANLQKETQICVDVAERTGVTSATASAALRETGAAAAVILTDLGDGQPSILAAPDNNWAMVNVAALGNDAELAKKEALRAMVMCSGGYLSQVPITLMGPFRNLKQVKAIPTDRLPADSVMKMKNYLKEYGVEPYQVTVYMKACREGWAPAPTNEFQKAIWDKVHEIPTKPLKIEFDPKTDTK